MINQQVLRTLCVASLICLVGCGGGGESEDSSSGDATASNNDSSSDAAADLGMPDVDGGGEHGSGGGEAGMMDGDLAMMEGDPAMMNGGSAPGGNELSGEHAGGGADMEAAMKEGAMLGAGGPSSGGKPRKPPRPPKIEDWTPDQIADAIRESDTKVIKVIELHATKSKGQVRGVEKLKIWLAALSEKPEQTSGGNFGGGGDISSGEAMMLDESSMQPGGGFGNSMSQAGPSKKQQITEAILNAFATNGTKPAYLTLGLILAGQLEAGEDKTKSMEMAFVTLMKNVADPNNPAKGQLLKAMTAVELDGAAPPKKDQEENPVAALQNRVKELHLGFAIASLNGLMGARTAPPQGRRNQNSFMSSGDESMMDLGTGGGFNGPPQGGPPQGGPAQSGPAPSARPVKAAPIVLDHAEAQKTLSYLWSDEMVAYAVSQLEKHPESAEAFVFAASFPLPAARTAVRSTINTHRLEPPNQWIHKSVFAQQLADPAIHLLVKEFPREARPTGNQGGTGENPSTSRRPRPKKKKDDSPNALRRREASYGWMDVSETTLISLMQRMYEGSLQPEAEAYKPKDIPLSVHKGAEITASLRFALPGADGTSSELKKAQQTIVNYVRIESSQMNNRTVQHYRNAMRDKTVVTILGGKGMWLDGPVKPNRKNGTLRTVDVVLSKSGARPTIKSRDGRLAQNQNPGGFSGEENFGGGIGGGGGTFVVEILSVEIPPELTEEEAPEVTAKN